MGAYDGGLKFDPVPDSVPGAFRRLYDKLAGAFSAPGSEALIGGPMGFFPRGARMPMSAIKEFDHTIASEPASSFRSPINEGPVNPMSNTWRDAQTERGYNAMDAHSYNDMIEGLESSFNTRNFSNWKKPR